MKLTLSSFELMVSPITLVRSSVVAIDDSDLHSIECSNDYRRQVFLSRKSATQSRFDFFSQKLGEPDYENCGFVAINDQRRSLAFEVALDDEAFESLLTTIRGFRYDGCELEVVIVVSDFVSDVRGGRGAILETSPTIWVRGIQS